MMAAPRTTRTAERALNPILGKSLVCYLRKPPTDQREQPELLHGASCGRLSCPASSVAPT